MFLVVGNNPITNPYNWPSLHPHKKIRWLDLISHRLTNPSHYRGQSAYLYSNTLCFT